MSALENGKYEKLAQELGKGLPQADAFLNAGFSCKNRNSAAAQCNKLLKKHPEINARADELKMIARNEITIDDFKGDIETLTRMYLQDRMFAQQCGQPGAAVSATNGLAKLFGQGAENINSNVSGRLDVAQILIEPVKPDVDSEG